MAKSAIESSSTAGYVDWSAIWLGTSVAVAISVVLTQFGVSAGLEAGNPMIDDTTPSWRVLVAGLWLVLMALFSSAVGGYLTGRLRRPVTATSQQGEREMRDGAHGLAAWAVATTVMAIAIASMAAFGAASAGAIASNSVAGVPEAAVRYASNGTVIIGFSSAAGGAIGAAAAWFSAEAGGKHRDVGYDLALLTPVFLRRK